jgi:hypothetical protein
MCRSYTPVTRPAAEKPAGIAGEAEAAQADDKPGLAPCNSDFYYFFTRRYTRIPPILSMTTL